MTAKLLDYFGNSHAAYIHASGKRASCKMAELLEAKEGEKILEVGFGTGASLVRMAAQSKACFQGYELSSIMYEKALERIRFSKMSGRITIHLMEKKNHFPAADNTFNKVYCESIIAIQEGSDFNTLLLEIKRVLKPGGVLLFNETIWLDTTGKDHAKNINEQCKNAFGIIQSTHEYLHLADWKKVLTEMGFIPELVLPVSEIRQIKEKISLPVISSKIYSLTGKIKTLTPSMKREWKNYHTAIASIMKDSEKLMEGIIIRANKIK